MCADERSLLITIEFFMHRALILCGLGVVALCTSCVETITGMETFSQQN